jgi:N-acetylmuramic acid 6-phosphate etherase
MATEDVDPRFADLDLWTNEQALHALYEAQIAAVTSVGSALPAIAAAVEQAVLRLRQGGRLIYAGAGTSGRIAVQDGAELAPTFDWPRDRVAFAMAGGEAALLQAVENAEDQAASGAARMAELGVNRNDVVIGLAASGETAFTIAALEAARAQGALTIAIANTPGSRLLSACDHPILVDTGAEPVAGSTRLKAGTAQKVVLNLISTQIMVRLGRVYAGLMVHMRPTNAKLRRRAVRMVMSITGVSENAAGETLAKADGDVKLAVLLTHGLDAPSGRALLTKHDGNLRSALSEAAAQRAG